MQTAYCPDSHDQLASKCVGKAHGHVPGHTYHDVDTVVSVGAGLDYRVHVCESWGSARGHDEEHGRREVIVRGSTVTEAVSLARERAKMSGIDCVYLEQSLSLAEDEALETLLTAS